MPPKFKTLKGLSDAVSTPKKKFMVGERSQKFDEFKYHHPIFAFDYISLNQSELCFDGKLLGRKDYTDLLKGLKRISVETYDSLNNNRMFHFHPIDWSDTSVLESDFNKCIGSDTGDITPYQFKVFREARVIGFVYQGVFYLVMYDRGHNAYKRK